MMATATGTIRVEASPELSDLVSRLEAVKVALMAVGPDSKVIITSPRPIPPTGRKRLEEAVSRELYGAKVIALEDGLAIKSTVERYEPEAITAKCGNIEITSDRHAHWEMTIDGKPVRRMQKVVLTMEIGSATTCEVTTIPDYHSRTEGPEKE
jgi:hypothetical protein